MTCEINEQRIMQAIDGALTARERALLDEHLHHCAACRSAWEEYSALAVMANALAREPQGNAPSDAFTDQVWARVAARSDIGVSRRRFGWTIAGALAAAGACVALGSVLPPLPVAPPDMHQALSLTSTARASLDVSPWLAGSVSMLAASFEAAIRAASHGYTLPAWVPAVLAGTAGLNLVFFARVRRQAAS